MWQPRQRRRSARTAPAGVRGAVVPATPTRRTPAARRLVGQCEAFVAGALTERLEAQGETVPAWAWTNLLAHGSEDDLRAACAEDRGRPACLADWWREARSYLAAEVLALADRHGPLAELQRTLLVPLELRLASSTTVADWDPRQWVACVGDSLEEHRYAGRRADRHAAHQPG